MVEKPLDLLREVTRRKSNLADRINKFLDEKKILPEKKPEDVVDPLIQNLASS